MEMEQRMERLMAAEASREEQPLRRGKSTQARASHWPRGVMMERVAYLKEMARFSSGEAADTVRDLQGHAAEMLYQSRASEPRLDGQHGYLFVVLAGAATLVSGGRLLGARPLDASTLSGTEIEGGVAQRLAAGDIAYVAAGVAYRWRMEGEQSISCFALRIAQPPESE